MINMTKPGIGSEKTETIPVKAKRTPNIQLSIKPTEIFLLGVVCSLIVLKLVNKKCQNFPYFYFFTKENFVQRGADDPTWLDPTIVGDRHVGYPLLCDVARATRRTAEVSAPRYAKSLERFCITRYYAICFHSLVGNLYIIRSYDKNKLYKNCLNFNIF